MEWFKKAGYCQPKQFSSLHYSKQKADKDVIFELFVICPLYDIKTRNCYISLNFLKLEQM